VRVLNIKGKTHIGQAVVSVNDNHMQEEYHVFFYHHGVVCVDHGVVYPYGRVSRTHGIAAGVEAVLLKPAHSKVIWSFLSRYLGPEW